MSDPIEALGYFECLIEIESRYTTKKLCIIKNKDAVNILGINSVISLNLVKLKSDDKKIVKKIQEENNNIDKLLEDYNDVFDDDDDDDGDDDDDDNELLLWYG